MSDNLALWESAQTTNPDYTKEFSRSGGFHGTAINPTYMVKCATERFGPLGIGWGYSIDDEAYTEGAEVSDKNGSVCREVIHKIRLTLWYKLGKDRGEVTHFGQTTFVGKNKYGFFTDEEAPKKSLTDALTKCLSMLGFGADVFMGLYDDNKYVEGLRAANELSKANARPVFERLQKEVRTLPSVEGMELWGKANSVDISSLPSDWKEVIREEYKARLLKLRDGADAPQFADKTKQDGFDAQAPAGKAAGEKYVGIALAEMKKRRTPNAAWLWFHNEAPVRESLGLTGEQEAQITDALIAEFGPEPAREAAE